MAQKPSRSTRTRRGETGQNMQRNTIETETNVTGPGTTETETNETDERNEKVRVYH